MGNSLNKGGFMVWNRKRALGGWVFLEFSIDSVSFLNAVSCGVKYSQYII